MHHFRQNAAELFEHLGHHHAYQDPIKRVNWLRLNREDFWLPEDAVSLYGLPEYTMLPQKDRKTLSQYEFMHMLEVGAWFKSLLLERLVGSALAAHDDIVLYKYHLSEMREVVGNNMVFTEIIQRSELMRIPFQNGSFSWIRRVIRHASIDSPAFWLALLVIEDIPNRVFKIIRQQKSHVCPAIFDVAMYHSIEESQHIALIQRVINTGIQQLSPLRYFAIRFLLARMVNEFCSLYFYPQTRVYDHAGLVPGATWLCLAHKNPHRIQFVRRQSDGLIRNLQQLGIYLSR